jgi:hypothetical protein
LNDKLGKLPSRNDVLNFLFASSTYGNLGLFVGAGFSKAVFASIEENIALSWGELLTKASKNMGMNFAKFSCEGSSYPELASALCTAHAKKTGGSFSISLKALKQSLSTSTAWYPKEPKKTEYSNYIKDLSPSWIITTNYDQILECLLPGASISLGPNDSFISQKNIIPIYHLHGVRTHPDELVISQADYVSLFRPNEYRQIRLALAIKESTTCLLGYGLGDVNVLTALDWSSEVYKESRGDYPHEVIQVIRQKEPESEPYRLENGIVVIETTSISTFCKEYAAVAAKLRVKKKQYMKNLELIAKAFKDAKEDYVNRFIDDEKWRRLALKALDKNVVNLVAEFEIFLRKALDESKRRSGKPGAFHAYATNLNIIIDFLNAFENEHFPPALLAVLVPNFDRLAMYIGDDFGASWEAKSVWDKRKGELSSTTVAELRAIALQYNYVTLTKLLGEL